MERDIVWGGYMEVGDIVIADNMKRYIIVEKIKKPSRTYQIVEFGTVIVSDWFKLVCIRYGEILPYPQEKLKFFKAGTRSEYVQAMENVRPEDRVQLDCLKRLFGEYECAKRDVGSIFINRR